MIKYPDGLVLACLLVLALHDHHPPNFEPFLGSPRIIGSPLLCLQIVSYVHCGTKHGCELMLLNDACVFLLVCVDILRAALKLRLHLLFLHLRQHFRELPSPTLELCDFCRT
jgi:hypothetical protein